MKKRSISTNAVDALMKWASISSHKAQKEVAERVKNYIGDIDYNTMIKIIQGVTSEK